MGQETIKPVDQVGGVNNSGEIKKNLGEKKKLGIIKRIASLFADVFEGAPYPEHSSNRRKSI